MESLGKNQHFNLSYVLPNIYDRIGPTGLTVGTQAKKLEAVPTVLDNLAKSGSIPEEVLGIYFAPSAGSPKGELSFGQADTSKTTGAISYVPITTSSPASNYWGIDQSITYGSKPILTQGSGIVDTGKSMSSSTLSSSPTLFTPTGTTLILVSNGTFCTLKLDH